jgi:DNA-binding transcriptional regulator YiaG
MGSDCPGCAKAESRKAKVRSEQKPQNKKAAVTTAKLSFFIGRFLQKRRERLGLKQRELAELTGLWPSQISAWEFGTRNPGVKNLSLSIRTQPEGIGARAPDRACNTSSPILGGFF